MYSSTWLTPWLWWTAIYNPSLLKALLTDILWNDNRLLTQTRREHGHELGSEHLAQCLHWKKEIPGILGASLQMMPHTILIHTATCYDAVDVRMVEEVGTPCMEYARHSPMQPMTLHRTSARCSMRHGTRRSRTAFGATWLSGCRLSGMIKTTWKYFRP